MKKNKNKIIVALVVIVLVIVARMFNLQNYLSLENINSNLDQIRVFVSGRMLFSSLVFIGVYTLTVALALPIATVLSLACGIVMGLNLGVLLVVIGATFGACINFLLTRYLIGDQIQAKYASKLEKINRELESNGKNYLLMLRLIPVFPFFLINLAAGLSKVKFSTFLWTTAVGIIPGTFAYVYLGSSLTYLKEGNGLPVHIIIALALIGLMALLPVVYKKIKMQKTT